MYMVLSTPHEIEKSGVPTNEATSGAWQSNGTQPQMGVPIPGSFWTSRGFLIVSLLSANLTAIYFFVFHGGSVIQALWIYWLQSVIIGAVNVGRLLSYKLNYAGLAV